MKKILIIGLWILLLSSLGTAITNNAEASYNFEINGTIDSTRNHNATSDTTTNTTGIIGSGRSSGAAKQIKFSNGAFGLLNNDFTISFWANTTGTGDDRYIFSSQDEKGATDYLFNIGYQGGGLRFRIGEGSNLHAWIYDNTSFDVNDGSRHHIFLTFEENNGINAVSTCYVNNQLYYSYTNNYDNTEPDDNPYCIGAYCKDDGSDVLEFDGDYDQFIIYKRILTIDERTELYNSGGGYDPYSTLSYLNISDIDTSVFNVSQTENVFFANGDYFNLTILANTTTNITCNYWIALTNAPTTWFNCGEITGINGTNTIIKTPLDLHYYDIFGFFAKANCSNLDGDTAETTTIVLLKDIVNPTIISNLTNGTYTYKQNITGQFNFSDEVILNRFNITMDGITIDNLTFNNSDILNFTIVNNYTYNLSYPTTNLSLGDHELKIWLWDGHTATELIDKDAYKTTNGIFNNYIQYNFKPPYKETYIKMNNIEKSLFDTFTTEYNGLDRYTIKYKPTNPKTSHTFEIESDNKITIIKENKNYGGEWIIMDNHWLDFYLENEPNLKVDITAITDYKVLVQITGLKTAATTLEFHSIGDLNLITQTFNITIDDYPRLNISAYDQQGNPIQNFTATGISQDTGLTITGTTTNGSMTIFTAWNESYNLTITSPDYALYRNNKLQIIDEYEEWTNFTLYPTNTINITFKNELTDALVYNVSFELISDTYANNYTTNPNATKTINNLTPEDYIMRYSKSPDYPEKTYTFTLANQSYTTITAYLTNGSDTITITIIDQLNHFVEGAYLEVLKYDSTTNNYKLVETAQTNFEGKSEIHIFKNTEYYKFRIQHEGEYKEILPNKLLITTPTYIYGDELAFQIQLGESSTAAIYTIAGVISDFTYNNITGNIRFEYADPSSTMIRSCVTITKTYAGETTNYSQSCNTGSTGTILSSITKINSTLYKAQAHGYFNSATYLLNTYSYEFTIGDIMGKLGLYLIMLLTILLSLTFIYSPILALIITPLPLLLSSIAGFTTLPKSAAIGIQILFLILAFLISDRN